MEEIRILTKADVSEARSLWQSRFDDPEAFCDWYFSTRFQPDCCAGLFDGDRLLSMIHGCPMRLMIRGERVDALSLSGVSTQKDCERRGYLHAVMRFMLQLARKKDCPLIFFRPENFAVYRSLGQLACTRAKFSCGEGRLALDAEPLPEARVIMDCYRAAGARYAGFVDRDKRGFADRLSDYAACGGRLVAERRNGRIIGYAVLLDDNTVPEALAENDAIYKTLLARLPAGAAVKLPPDAPGEGTVRDGNVIAAANVQSLLKRFVRDPDLTFAVTDPAVIQNNGVFNGCGEEVGGVAQYAFTAGELTQAIVGYRALDGVLDEAVCYCVEEY